MQKLIFRIKILIGTVNMTVLLLLPLSLNSINFKGLLAWETYVNIAKASEVDNKQYQFTVNITLTEVSKE